MWFKESSYQVHSYKRKKHIHEKIRALKKSPESGMHCSAKNVNNTELGHDEKRELRTKVKEQNDREQKEKTLMTTEKMTNTTLYATYIFSHYRHISASGHIWKLLYLHKPTSL